MILKDEYVIADVGAEKIAVPVGERAIDSRMIVRMNDSASFIWKCLEKDMTCEQIAEKMMSEYSGVDYETALACVNEITDKMKNDGLVEIR